MPNAKLAYMVSHDFERCVPPTENTTMHCSGYPAGGPLYSQRPGVLLRMCRYCAAMVEYNIMVLEFHARSTKYDLWSRVTIT